MQVAKLLREHCLPDWEWTHFPSGEHRNMRTATKLKQMGLKRGWADFVFLPPGGIAHFLELKRVGEGLTVDQEDFRLRAITRGNPYVVAWTMDQVLIAFGAWGCTRLKLDKASSGHDGAPEPP